MLYSDIRIEHKWRKNVCTLYSQKMSNLLQCERDRRTETDGGGRRQTAMLTHNFFFPQPYHAVLSSRSHLVLLLLLGRWLLNRKPAVELSVGGCPSGASNHSLAHSVTERISAATAKSTARLIASHLNISIYQFTTPTHIRSNTWLLPLIYTDASCAEKSLIDGSVKGQYADVAVMLTPREKLFWIIDSACIWI